MTYRVTLQDVTGQSIYFVRDLKQDTAKYLADAWMMVTSEYAARQLGGTRSFHFISDCDNANSDDFTMKDLNDFKNALEVTLRNFHSITAISEIERIADKGIKHRSVYASRHSLGSVPVGFGLANHGGYPIVMPSIPAAMGTSSWIVNTGAGPASITLPGGMSFQSESIKSHKSPCQHEYTNVGFSHIKMVCRHCDQEQNT